MTTAVVKIANAKREEILMVQEEVALNNHKWVSTIFIMNKLTLEVNWHYQGHNRRHHSKMHGKRGGDGIIIIDWFVCKN